MANTYNSNGCIYEIIGQYIRKTRAKIKDNLVMRFKEKYR